MDAPVVGWLERPAEKIGLDNLGTQQPCIAIYSRLLPGVTNVTDRVSYFGFYPWFVRAFEQRFPHATDAEFRDALRRADCLYTLVAERHAIACGDHDASLHGAACAGRQKLGPAATALSAGSTLNITEYSNRAEENKKRYFKNPLGGLGQYYLGPSRDEYFVLFGNARSGIKYTLEHGEPLAIAYADGLDEDRFFEILAEDTIGATDLDALIDFCPCAIHNEGREGARRSLMRLLLEDRSSSGIARKTSFRLLMEFLEIGAGAPSTDPVKPFLGSCYTGVIGSEPWVVPEKLTPTGSKWALYARNEMMSLAWYTFFKLALDELDGQPKPFHDVRHFSDWLLGRPSFAFRETRDFDGMVEADRLAAPELSLMSAADHELALWRRITEERPPPVEAACKMLVRLVARWGDEVDCYRSLALPRGTLAPYPLTLDSLNQSARNRWCGFSCEEWLKSLLIDVLSAHQRVAIRKLGQAGEDALMFRISEAGMSVHRRLDRVVETQPRLEQAFHMLLDLGLTRSQSGALPTLTELGVKTLTGLRQ
jgi:hypothetical protein